MTKVLELFGEPFLCGGQESFVINVMQAINYTNLQIDICTPYEFNNKNYKQIIESKNGKIISFDLPFSVGGFRMSIFSPVYRYLKNNEYDVVHIHSGSVMALAVLSLAAKLAHTDKIIVHSHAAGEKENLKHIISKILSTPILCACSSDYFACSIEAAKWKFSKRTVNNKIQIIKNGIDINKFKISNEARERLRNELGYTEEDKVIGHVGRFSDEKNHRFIIELFSELKKESDEYKLLLLGDGILKPEIEQYARDKGVFGGIVFTGNVGNVQDYMQAMDLFVFPSKYEGLGIVGIEAQASGLPVIASDKVPKEMKITENVLFLPLDDMEKWVGTAEKMISSPRKDNKTIIKKAGYDIRSTAETVENIYLSVQKLKKEKVR